MLTVKLSHAMNPDIAGGYWSGANPDAPCHTLPVQDFREASSQCRRYIENNGLGAGNWTGGAVYLNRKKIAKVSYNGRVWAIDGTEINV